MCDGRWLTLEPLDMATAWHHETVKTGPQDVEQGRVEEWLDSLALL
jgi:hypothetical protein